MFGQCNFCIDKGDFWFKTFDKALDKKIIWYAWARNIIEEKFSA